MPENTQLPAENAEMPAESRQHAPRILNRVRAAIRRSVRYRITSGGALYFFAVLLVGFASFLTANNLLFLVFSAMLAILLVSGFLSRLMLSGLELELLLPNHVWARTAAPARLRLRNLKRFTPSFSIELSGQRSALSEAPPILTAPVYFPVVPGLTTAEASVDVTFPHRGRHKENVFQIATRFPFGFLRKTTTLELQRETLVYPAPRPFPEAAEVLNRLEAGEVNAAARGTGHDFYRIRPYEPGDSARHIDWKSSARTSAAHVREFSREENTLVEVILDRRTEAGSSARFEMAVERCAFLISRLAETESGLLFSAQGFTFAAAEEDDFYVILKYLARVEPLITVTSGASIESESGSRRVRVVFSLKPDAFQGNAWDDAFFVDSAE